MSTKRWKQPTPTEEFYIAMRATETWIKKEMIKHDAEIKANLELLREGRNEQG